MSSTANSSPSSTLRNPQEVLDSLPALLGFRPSDSLCILWLANGLVKLIQRVDIRHDRSNQSIEAWAADVMWTARHAQAQVAVVVWISGAQVSQELVGGLLRALRTGRVVVADCIISDGATYFTSSTTGTRRWAYTAGAHWELGARSALSYDPLDGADCQPVAGPLAMGVEDAVIASLMCGSGASNAGGVTDGPLILRALADQGRRDGLLWWVTEDVRIRAHVRDPLGALLPKVVRGHGADTAAVLAITHWLDGDGVRANSAVERGIEDDPQHRLVNLLGLAITAGLPPRVWREAMADLSFETCRRGVIPFERDHQPV